MLTDHEPPDLDQVVRAVAAAHDRGRPVALHSVTQLTLAVAIATLSTVDSRPGDRIEHAAVCDDAAADRLAALGVVVVTQPSLYRRYGEDFRAEVDPADRPHLWRYGGLRRAGVPVVASSDAPYGRINPWHGIEAATERALDPSADDKTGDEGDERVTAAVALGSYLTAPLDLAGPPRTIAPGQSADLCLLTRPLHHVLADPGRTAADVAAVFIAGEIVFQAEK